MQLRTCTVADTPLLVQALNECLYRGYRFKVVMTPERFVDDARVHDIDLSSTWLAVVGDEPVGVTLVARRGGAAWIAGMGVHPTHRHRRLGTRLLAKALERLHGLGVESVELEVLVENAVARQCYAAAGFVARRRYSCFRGTASRIPWGRPASRVLKAAPTKVLELYEQHHHADACWQRNFPTLRNRGNSLRAFLAVQDRRVVASLLTSDNAVADVGWAGADPPLERPLYDLLVASFGPTKPFAIVNVPSDDPLHPVMVEGGFEIYAEQLDMRCLLQ
jgi:ribosomal protein S18 acetylase RimI-like enzyme